MANQEWNKVGKIFDDKGLRLKVEVTHGGLEYFSGKTAGHLPRTWGAITIMPNDGESIPDFVKRIGVTDSYEAFAKEKGKREADATISKEGMGLVSLQGELLGTRSPEQVVTELLSKLSDQRLSLDPKIVGEIRTLLDKNLSGEALKEAQQAFARTGGKPAGEAARG